jgi:MFS family permease
MNMKSRLKAYGMWLLPLLFFTGQFVLRLWPGLMMQDIMQQFKIDAAQFGLLASAYYYGYALMQMPVALALDRFGARVVISACAALLGVSTLLFVNTQSWPMALIARFLIGAGSAAGFLGTSKIVSEWFSRAQYTHMIGLSFTVGLLGAVYGGKPTNQLIEWYGGYTVWSMAGWISLFLGGIIFTLLRAPHAVENIDDRIQVRDLAAALSSSRLWVLAVANLLMVGTLEGFADVWGVNYLMIQYYFTKSNAAQLVSCIYLGMVFGGPLLAVISRIFGVYKTVCICGLGMALGLLAIIGTSLNVYVLTILFFILGLLCCYQVLVFSVANELTQSKHLGITVAFLNCINMLGGSFFHTIVGRVMDSFWTGTLDHGVHTYTSQSYQYGLSVIPISALLGVLCVYWLMRKRY